MNAKLVMLGIAALVCAGFGMAPCAIAGEDVVTIDQTPAAVKTAIEKVVGDGTIKEIEKETEDGKTVYEVEFVKDGKKQEAEFTEDGKPADEDDDEDDDDDDDDDEKDDEEHDGEDKD